MTSRHSHTFKIGRARSELIRIAPFFGTLALRLSPEPLDSPAVPVMGTNGISLFYNIAEVESMSQPEVTGVLAHEVLHCALQHIWRRHHRNPLRWNMACDYVVNAILLQEGYSLPEGRLFDPQYKGMSAEEVYDKLAQQQGSSGCNGSGNWNFGASLDPNLPSPKTGKSQSVSAVHATAKEWEILTKQAAHIAKQAGKLPGGLESIIDELLQPQISWRQQLWRFFNQRVPDRISWNRPNRRLIAQGVYLPSRKHIPSGDIIIAVDTSGSISERELQHFATEIQEVHKTLQPKKLYVVDVDTQIQGRVKEYGPYDQPEFTYKGRGGTDFDPVFKWAEAENIRPDALVYLTDGYAEWPEEPSYPVLWCITNHDRTPPWGEHLILEV